MGGGEWLCAKGSIVEATWNWSKSVSADTILTEWKFGVGFTAAVLTNRSILRIVGLQQECDDGIFMWPHLPAIRWQQSFSWGVKADPGARHAITRGPRMVAIKPKTASLETSFNGLNIPLLQCLAQSINNALSRGCGLILLPSKTSAKVGETFLSALGAS